MAAQRGFLDDVYAEQQKKSSKCGVNKAIIGLGDEGPQLLEVLADRSVPGVVIAKVLKDRGFAIGADAVNRHRRGLCNCDSR